jgi:hypothetical protein
LTDLPVRDLVEEFVRATDSLPAGDSARVAGVSEATYHRWRRQPPRMLRALQRTRIERYLGLTEADPVVWLG